MIPLFFKDNQKIEKYLQVLSEVGLGYIKLGQPSNTLSGGEAQRIRLASQIGAGLVGVMYILDEPSIGLHQRDNQRLLNTLTYLRDLGNTVIVVEHDEETIRVADHVVDIGPGAGERGGGAGVECRSADPTGGDGRRLRRSARDQLEQLEEELFAMLAAAAMGPVNARLPEALLVPISPDAEAAPYMRRAREVLGWNAASSSLETIVETAWRWHSMREAHRGRGVEVLPCVRSPKPQPHVGAVSRELAHRRPADPRRAAGDDDDGAGRGGSGASVHPDRRTRGCASGSGPGLPERISIALLDHTHRF